MNSPFELPEVSALIAKHLSRHNLTVSIRVCKNWHRYFISIIWNRLCITAEKQYYHFTRHAYLIKTIQIETLSSSFITNIHFPRLRSLSISHVEGHNWKYLPLLLSNNPSIEEFHMKARIPIAHNLEFWKSIMELQHLKKLTIRGHTITPEVAFAFWDILCRMETVEFTRVELKGVSLPVSMTPSNIKSLNLTMMKMTLQQQMDLVEKCTGLECLRLEGEIPEDAIANCLQRATLQHLHHINLSRILLGNDCLQKILGSVTKLTVLDINCSKWGFESVNALSNHFESLEIFRLPSKLPFDPLTSILVSRVMSSCPNLKTLNASVVKGLDIINASLAKEIGKPDIGWACTRLTHLGLRFDLTDLESQKPIVELIGSLTLIKELDISTHYSFALPSIRFSLSHGLDDLKSLKNLTRLVVTGTKQESNVEDMNWMIENWRKLESVIGNFHENNRCREKLKGVLKYNRLKVF